MICIRCGRAEQLEEHHILERVHGGGDESANKEWRCRPCHKFEHTLRGLLGALEYEKQRGQLSRIKCYEHRIGVLEKLNTPELIIERKTYLSYWTDRSTRYLPHRIPTKEEAEQERQFNLLLDEAFVKGKNYKPQLLSI